VVDGHARVALAIKAGEKVPVVYVELDEREEAVILATLDPVTMPGDLWLLGSHRLLCADATAIDAVERLGVTPPLVKNCTLSTKEGASDVPEGRSRCGDLRACSSKNLICSSAPPAAQHSRAQRPVEVVMGRLN
jgi:hypothetical protein